MKICRVVKLLAPCMLLFSTWSCVSFRSRWSTCKQLNCSGRHDRTTLDLNVLSGAYKQIIFEGVCMFPAVTPVWQELYNLQLPTPAFNAKTFTSSAAAFSDSCSDPTSMIFHTHIFSCQNVDIAIFNGVTLFFLNIWNGADRKNAFQVRGGTSSRLSRKFICHRQSTFGLTMTWMTENLQTHYYLIK